MKNLLNNLSFKTKDNQLSSLFGEKAQEVAKKMEVVKNNNRIEKIATSTTQFRKFYEKVLELNNKAIGLNQNEFETNIKPFVMMLNSKVQYSHTRGNCCKNFVELMESSIKAVNSVEELQNFKYFLESIIGFMPKK